MGGGDPLKPRSNDLAPDPSLVKNIVARLAAHSSKHIYRTIASDPRADSLIECSAAMSVWNMLRVVAPLNQCSPEMVASNREFMRADFVKLLGLVVMPSAES